MKRALFALAAVLVAARLLGVADLVAQGTTPAPAPSDAFFDDSTVHSIYLNINSKDWETLRQNYLANDYYPCDLKWNSVTVRNVGVRSRGTGSRSGTKPGLRVDIDRYTSSQKFLGLKSFVLRNQTQDPSNMHERLSMLLFQRLGVKSPREAFAKLYVNNAYSGLYSIVESVDKIFLMRSFGEDSGFLYKYDYPADAQPYFFEDRGTNADAYVPLPFKPETHESDPQPQPIVELVRVVNTDSDAAFPTTVAPYVNWQNFTRHIAIENVLADQDGFNGDYGVNNFYWYRYNNQKLFVWIPWDKSESFKNGSGQTIFRNFLDGSPSRRNRLSARAMTIPAVQAMYLDALVEAARSLSEPDPTNPADTRGWMEREIQREYDQIKDLVYSDPLKPFTNAQFEAEVETLRAFARERPVFVINAVNEFRNR